MHIPPARWVALAGTVGISFSALFVVLADVSPITATIFRGIYALPVLLVIRLLWRDRDTRPPRLRWLAVAAGAFLAVDLVLWHESIALIGAGLATVIANVQVVFVGMYAWVVYKERPTLQTLVCGAIVFLGVVLTSGLGRTDAFGADPILGTLLAVASGLAYTAFLLMFRQSNPGGDTPAPLPLLDTTVGMTVVALVVAAVAGDLALAPTWPAHGWLILLGVGLQAGAWTLIAYAMPRLPALTVSVIILAQPVLAVVWGWLWLDETLSTVQIVGAVLLLGGMSAVNLQRSMFTSREPVPLPAG
jgi:drug/metabolite transporter (DMT)-like permease